MSDWRSRAVKIDGPLAKADPQPSDGGWRSRAQKVEESTPEEKSLWQQAKEFAGSTLATAEGMIPGVGIIDKVGAANYATQQEIGDLFRDEANQKPWKERYQDEVSRKDRERSEASDKSTAGKVAGSVAGLAANAVIPIPGAGMKGLAGIGSRVLSSAGIAGVDEGTRNPGKLFDKDRAKNAAAISGGVGAAIESIPAVGKGLAWLGKKQARVLTGLPEAHIDHYLKNSKDVNAALDPEDLKNFIDDDVRTFTSKVEDAKDKLASSRHAESIAQQSAKASRATAEQNAKNSFISSKEMLAKTKPPESLAKELVNHLSDAGDALSAKSSKAFDILEKEGHSFKMQDLDSAVQKEMDRLTIAGVAPTIGPEAQAYKALSNFKNMLEEIALKKGGEIGDATLEASWVKKLVQNLDSASKAAYSTEAGSLGPEAAERLASVRGSFDKALKEASPVYKAHMQDLAGDTELITSMSKVFGKEKNAMLALNSMANPKSPNGKIAMRMVEKYDEKNGTDFVKQLRTYLKSQDILRSPTGLEKFRQSLPEVQALSKELPEELSYKEAMAGRDAAEKMIEETKAWEEPLRRLGPGSTENVIKSVGAGRNFETQKSLDFLSELTGKDYMKQIKDSGVKQSFSKDRTHGSRMTALGGIVGASIGGAIGGPIASGIGASIGGATGATLDKFGGQIVKSILDGTLKAGPYTKLLVDAAKRGNNAAAVTHILLMKKDPEYRKLIEGQQQSIENP